jgi:hypothetical protein
MKAARQLRSRAGAGRNPRGKRRGAALEQGGTHVGWHRRVARVLAAAVHVRHWRGNGTRQAWEQARPFCILMMRCALRAGRACVLVRVPVLRQARLAARQQAVNRRSVGLRHRARVRRAHTRSENTAPWRAHQARATHHAAVLLELVAHAAELRARGRASGLKRSAAQGAGRERVQRCAGRRAAWKRRGRTHLLVEERAVDTPAEHGAQALPARRKDRAARVQSRPANAAQNAHSARAARRNKQPSSSCSFAMRRRLAERRACGEPA